MVGILWNIALGLGLGAYAVVDRFRTGRRRTDLRTRNGAVDVPLLSPGRAASGDCSAEARAPGLRLLVHGVSVGEVNAVTPLVEALDEDAHVQVVVSSATETGYARATKLHEGRRPVVRYPLDFTWMVGRFLDRTRPDAVVLVEQELWPGFLRECRRRRIPVCLVNARMSESSFQRYKAFGPVARWLLRTLDLVVCQSDVYRDQFVRLGADPAHTHVTGSLKWDAALPTGDPTRAAALSDSLGIDRDRPLVVAGSTGPGEERRLLESLPPGAQLLLAPRRPERWDEVAGLRPGMPRRSAIREGNGAQTGSHDVFLLDTIGELTDAYHLADAVFVGRSLVPQGGSNPLESVAQGKPTVMGPHFENFKDVVAELVGAGGLAISDQPMSQIGEWLREPSRASAVAEAGLRAMAHNRGSARRTGELVLDRIRSGQATGHHRSRG